MDDIRNIKIREELLDLSKELSAELGHIKGERGDDDLDYEYKRGVSETLQLTLRKINARLDRLSAEYEKHKK